MFYYMAKSQNLPPSPGPLKNECLVVCLRGLTVFRGPFFFTALIVFAYFSLVLLIFLWFWLFWDLAI